MYVHLYVGLWILSLAIFPSFTYFRHTDWILFCYRINTDLPNISRKPLDHSHKIDGWFNFETVLRKCIPYANYSLENFSL